MKKRNSDILSKLLQSGRICPAEYEAGTKFAEEFSKAHIDIRSVNYDAVGSDGGSRSSIVEQAVVFGQPVWRAVDAIGGMESFTGRVIWNVLGMAVTLNEWAKINGLDYREAMGMLRAALRLLAKHYRFL